MKLVSSPAVCVASVSLVRHFAYPPRKTLRRSWQNWSSLFDSTSANQDYKRITTVWFVKKAVGVVSDQNLSPARLSVEVGFLGREAASPSPPARGLGSTVSIPSGIWGEAPAAKRFFTCVSYAEARNSYRLDVRLSVRHTLAPYQKRLNILSCFLHHTIAHSF